MSIPKSQSGPDPFPPTRWSVLNAAAGDATARTEALADLGLRYGGALFAVARRRGASLHDAEDAVQAFFTKVAADPRFFEGLDPARGRFRAFVRTAFDRFLANLHEAASAEKRGRGKIVPLDIAAAEQASGHLPTEPDAAFERAWAEAVVRKASARWRDARDADGRGAETPAIAAYLTPGATPLPLSEAAAMHGLTAPQLKSLIHRARVEFRALVRAELAAEGTSAEDMDAEVAALTEALLK